MMTKLRHLYLLFLYFDAETKNYFYTLLREFTLSKFSLMELFDELQDHGGKALKTISRISKQSIRRNQPFAAQYAQSGYFTKNEAELLIMAERYDCIDEVTSMLIRQDEQGSPLAQILAPSMQWIGMLLIMTLMSVYVMPYMERFSEGYEWYFAYIALVRDDYELMLMAACLLLSLYLGIRANLVGPVRDRVERLGIFRLYAITTELQFMRISMRLTKTRIPPIEFMDLMLGIFSWNNQMQYRIYEARKRLRESSLIDVLGGVVSSDNFRHVLASAPNRTADEIAAGFGNAVNMQTIRLNMLIKVYRTVSVMVLVLLTIAITIPFAYISMGMGMNATP